MGQLLSGVWGQQGLPKSAEQGRIWQPGPFPPSQPEARQLGSTEAAPAPHGLGHRMKLGRGVSPLAGVRNRPCEGFQGQAQSQTGQEEHLQQGQVWLCQLSTWSQTQQIFLNKSFSAHPKIVPLGVPKKSLITGRSEVTTEYPAASSVGTEIFNMIMLKPQI